MKIWEPKPPVTLWAIPGLLREPFTFIFNFYVYERTNYFFQIVQKELEVVVSGGGLDCGSSVSSYVPS